MQREQADVAPLAIMTLMILFVLGLIVWIVGGQLKQAKDEASPIYRVDAIEMLREYDRNEVDADHRYRGKIVEVYGSVRRVAREIFGDQPYVDLETGDSWRPVHCSFSEDDRSQLYGLSPGRVVRIRGIGDGLWGSVKVKKCQVVSN